MKIHHEGVATKVAATCGDVSVGTIVDVDMFMVSSFLLKRSFHLRAVMVPV